jgi:hypothetical protein
MLARGGESPVITALPPDKPPKGSLPPAQGSPTRAETVTFGNGYKNTVIVLRGRPPELPPEAAKTLPEAPTPVEVQYGPTSKEVRTQRLGTRASDAVAGHHMLSSEPTPDMIDRKIETVQFGDPRYQPVTVIRGLVSQTSSTDLFNASTETDLDHIAFAVEAAESAYGTDPRMWRPEPNGPQGPMQVSLAAATDVGGGNRFDERENRTLGRAYLNHLYQRYGNWPDAVAAYNWGPSNVDVWISAGRPVDKLPLEVERYRSYVLRHAVLPDTAAATSTSAPLGQK